MSSALQTAWTTGSELLARALLVSILRVWASIYSTYIVSVKQIHCSVWEHCYINADAFLGLDRTSQLSGIGHELNRVLGPNPKGTMMADANGRFSIMVVRSDLPKFASIA